MKNIFLFLFCLSSTLNCNSSPKSIDQNPIDKNTDWSAENLVGKVKTLEQYTSKINSRTQNEGEPILESKMSFTSFGRISSQEFFDFSGQRISNLKNEYNNKNQQVKSEQISPEFSYTTSFIFNTKGEIKTATMKSDFGNMTYQYTYDEYGSILSENINSNNNVSRIVSYSYEYNSSEKPTKKVQYSNEKEGENITNYTYDERNNLIKIEDNFHMFPLNTIINEYDLENRLTSVKTLMDNKLFIVSEYDDTGNCISTTNYNNSEPTNKFVYEFKFDDQGNWIEQKTYIVSIGETKEKTLTTIQTRTINYF